MARLSNTEVDKLTKIERQKKFKDIQLVKTNNIIDHQSKLTLAIKLPDYKELIYAKATSIEAYNFDNYTWKGKLKNHLGFVILIAENGNVFGQIQIDGETYELTSLKPGVSILKHYDKLRLQDPPGCVLVKSDEAQSQTPIGQIRSSCGPIRILFLATTDAANELGGLSGVSQMATTSTSILNSSMNNSNIDASFNIADVQIFPNIVESNYTMEQIGNKVMLNDLKNMAATICDDEQADLVVLYCTDYIYYAGVSEGTGPYNAYCQVNLDYANSEFSLGHEIGHLMGGDHEPCNADRISYGCIQSSVQGENRAHVFKKAIYNWKATIMRGATDLVNGINYYSNPDVYYSGKATGVLNERDNARTLEFNACTVANLKPYDPPMSVSISGPSKAYNSGNYTWCAQVSNCTNVTSYDWDYSIDGFNYYPWANIKCNTTVMPLDADLFLRLTVTCSTSEVKTAFHYTMNLDINYLAKDIISNESFPYVEGMNSPTKLNVNAVKIYPNPSSGSNINVIFQLAKSGLISLDLLDNLGNNIKRISKAKYDKGVNKIEMKLSELPPGLYFLRTVTEQEILSTSFILLP